jgi:hypothetical protein
LKLVDPQVDRFIADPLKGSAVLYRVVFHTFSL